MSTTFSVPVDSFGRVSESNLTSRLQTWEQLNLETLNLTDSHLQTNKTDSLNQFVSIELRDAVLQVMIIPIILVALVGVVNNVLNMATFWKMGFNVTTNISFFALSMTGFVSNCVIIVICASMLEVCGLMNLGVDLTEVLFLMTPVASSLSAFGSWVTAIVNVERCFSIFYPGRVKDVFTRKTTLSLIAGMFFLQVTNVSLNMSQMNPAVSKSPTGHEDQLVLDLSADDKDMYVSLMFWASSFTTLVCFCVVATSTTFLAIALQQRKRWLQSLPGGQSTSIKKDKKLIRAVVIISTVFIFCFAPGSLRILTIFAFPDLNPLDSRYKNFSFIAAAFIGLLHALSDSVNFFVYFQMSSNFRQCLKEWLCRSPVIMRNWVVPA